MPILVFDTGTLASAKAAQKRNVKRLAALRPKGQIACGFLWFPLGERSNVQL
jgi:hypothetical protein